MKLVFFFSILINVLFAAEDAKSLPICKVRTVSDIHPRIIAIGDVHGNYEGYVS
jgi:hypothetical protein